MAFVEMEVAGEAPALQQRCLLQRFADGGGAGPDSRQGADFVPQILEAGQEGGGGGVVADGEEGGVGAGPDVVVEAGAALGAVAGEAGPAGVAAGGDFLEEGEDGGVEDDVVENPDGFHGRGSWGAGFIMARRLRSPREWARL